MNNTQTQTQTRGIDPLVVTDKKTNRRIDKVLLVTRIIELNGSPIVLRKWLMQHEVTKQITSDTCDYAIFTNPSKYKVSRGKYDLGLLLQDLFSKQNS